MPKGGADDAQKSSSDELKKKRESAQISLNDVSDPSTQNDPIKSEIRHSIFGESDFTLEAIPRDPKARKLPLSQIFNFEDDFILILSKERERIELGELEQQKPKPPKIVLEKLYEQGKPENIFKERKNHIPTREEMKTPPPTGKDFWWYMVRLVFLVLIAIAYTIIDIVLYNQFFKDKAALYATSVNLLGVCFDFLWKYMNCLEVYPYALRKTYSKILGGVLGCMVHMLAILGIRYPLYQAYEDGNKCPAGQIFFLGVFFYLLITYSLDYFAMPLLLRRLDPIGRDVMQEKMTRKGFNPKVSLIGFFTYIWIILWFIITLTTIAIRFTGFSIAMEICLWVPMLITGITTLVEKGKGLIHSVQYLIYYMWFMYLIPQLSASVLVAFFFLETTSYRFVLSIIFIALAQVYLVLTINIAGNMGNGGSPAHFVFIVQLFEYFFGALFFINVNMDGLFWFLLLIQSFWLIFRNSGIAQDFWIYTYETFLKNQISKIELEKIHKSLKVNLTFESSRKRLYHHCRMAVQYTICDTTVLIAIPIQYYFTTSFMTGQELERYAAFFQMTLAEHEAGKLYVRFLVVAAFKIVFHIIAHSLLFYKVKSYNHQARIYGLPVISFVGIFSTYLTKYFYYFIIMILACMKISYITYSVILSANLTYKQSLEPGSRFQGLSQREIFWLQDIYVFVGYRFVTIDQPCG